jgi:hypothetical protein
MQQQIGFCSTADGVRIAYATVGTGPALMVVPHTPCHLGLEWEEPRVREFWEAVGRHHLMHREPQSPIQPSTLEPNISTPLSPKRA